MLIAVLAIALLVGVVSAATISYFGQVKMTANVTQAVLVDGHSYPYVIEEPADVAGGESFCRYHWLTSQTSVPVQLQFETDKGGAGDEITLKYYAMGTSTTWHVIPSVEAYVTKTDKADSVEFKVEIVPDSDHYGMGIAISTSRATIDFQVWYREYAEPKGWYYEEYGTGWGSKPVIALPHLGITATGVYTEKVFTVDIPIGLLGGCGAEYYFAIQFRTTLLGTYPEGLDLWAQTDASLFAGAIVGTIPTMPITLKPGEVLPFYICYEFAENIQAGTYDIYTTIKPYP
jgi:hypothetical protein